MRKEPSPTSTAGLLEPGGQWMREHRCHDVSHLLRRWRAVARVARMRLQIVHETAGFPVYFLTTHHVSRRPLYFSAGVHGDEPAAVLGLLEWAEHSVEYLRGGDAVVVPLFNPVGLSLNTRADANGLDLNRAFDHSHHPHIAGWRDAIKGMAPRFAVCLHEDYDGQGSYAYELNRNSALAPGNHCLNATNNILPVDTRKSIDGRHSKAGLIRPRRIPMQIDLPEAVVLYRSGTPCTLTFETPSEFSLDLRTLAHTRFLTSFQRWEVENGLPGSALTPAIDSENRERAARLDAGHESKGACCKPESTSPRLASRQDSCFN